MSRGFVQAPRKRLLWSAMLLTLAAFIAGPMLLARGSASSPTFSSAREVSDAGPRREPLLPVSRPTTLDPRKVALGARLFNDARMSRDDTIACASCHDLAGGGADRRARSVGIGGRVAAVNTPTVLNAALDFKQLWDGRADSLEDQVEKNVHSPAMMDSSWPQIIGKLQRDRGYVADFTTIYGGPIEGTHIKDAIATFERSLITESRFDRFLRGDARAITDDEKVGYDRFKSYGCVACHQGANAGGNMFQTFGAVADYFAGRAVLDKADLGRFNVTGRERDRHRFKVPGLRNVALTAPYFHDGSAATLPEAVATMARYQLGRSLSDRDTALIVSFLNSLTREDLDPR